MGGKVEPYVHMNVGTWLWLEASCADEWNTHWAGLGRGTMDRIILAGIRAKTFVKSEALGFNDQADRWLHVLCLWEDQWWAGRNPQLLFFYSINYKAICCSPTQCMTSVLAPLSVLIRYKFELIKESHNERNLPRSISPPHWSYQGSLAAQMKENGNLFLIKKCVDNKKIKLHCRNSMEINQMRIYETSGRQRRVGHRSS